MGSYSQLRAFGSWESSSSLDSTAIQPTTTSMGDGLLWAFSCCLVALSTHAQRGVRRHFLVSQKTLSAKRSLPTERHQLLMSCLREPVRLTAGAIRLFQAACWAVGRLGLDCLFCCGNAA